MPCARDPSPHFLPALCPLHTVLLGGAPDPVPWALLHGSQATTNALSCVKGFAGSPGSPSAEGRRWDRRLDLPPVHPCCQHRVGGTWGSSRTQWEHVGETLALGSSYVVRGWRRMKAFPLWFALASICAQDPSERTNICTAAAQALGTLELWETLSMGSAPAVRTSVGMPPRFPRETARPRGPAPARNSLPKGNAFSSPVQTGTDTPAKLAAPASAAVPAQRHAALAWGERAAGCRRGVGRGGWGQRELRGHRPPLPATRTCWLPRGAGAGTRAQGTALSPLPGWGAPKQMVPTDSPLHVALSVRAHSMPQCVHPLPCTLPHATHTQLTLHSPTLCTNSTPHTCTFTPSTRSPHQLCTAAMHSTHIHPHCSHFLHAPCTLTIHTAPCTIHAAYTLPLVTHSLVLRTLPTRPMHAHSVLHTIPCTREFPARAPCTPIHTPCTLTHATHTHPTPRALTCTLCTHTAHAHPTLRIRSPQATHTHHALRTPFAPSPGSSRTHPCPRPPALCPLPDLLAPCTLTSHPAQHRPHTRPPHPSRPAARAPFPVPHASSRLPARSSPLRARSPPRRPLPPRQAACDTPPPRPAATLSAPSFPRGLLSGRVGTRAPGAE